MSYTVNAIAHSSTSKCLLMVGTSGTIEQSLFYE